MMERRWIQVQGAGFKCGQEMNSGAGCGDVSRRYLCNDFEVEHGGKEMDPMAERAPCCFKHGR